MVLPWLWTCRRPLVAAKTDRWQVGWSNLQRQIAPRLSFRLKARFGFSGMAWRDGFLRFMGWLLIFLLVDWIRLKRETRVEHSIWLQLFGVNEVNLNHMFLWLPCGFRWCWASWINRYLWWRHRHLGFFATWIDGASISIKLKPRSIHARPTKLRLVNQAPKIVYRVSLCQLLCFITLESCIIFHHGT